MKSAARLAKCLLHPSKPNPGGGRGSAQANQNFVNLICSVSSKETITFAVAEFTARCDWASNRTRLTLVLFVCVTTFVRSSSSGLKKKKLQQLYKAFALRFHFFGTDYTVSFFPRRGQTVQSAEAG